MPAITSGSRALAIIAAVASLRSPIAKKSAGGADVVVEPALEDDSRGAYRGTPGRAASRYKQTALEALSTIATTAPCTTLRRSPLFQRRASAAISTSAPARCTRSDGR